MPFATYQMFRIFMLKWTIFDTLFLHVFSTEIIGFELLEFKSLVEFIYVLCEYISNRNDK